MSSEAAHLEWVNHRKPANDASRRLTTHQGDAWDGEDSEFLTSFWDHTEAGLKEVAAALGRTIEACRQRYYDITGDHGCGSQRQAITRKIDPRPAWMDAEGLPSYYVMA